MTGFHLHQGLRITTQAGGPDYEPPSTKVPLAGLVVRRVGDINGRPDDLGGVICDIHWEDIQPTEGGPIVTSSGGTYGWAQVTTALATGLPVKIRLHLGKWSPNYALAKGSFTIGDFDQNNAATVIPDYTNPAFLVLVDDLYTKVAAIVEPIAQIRELATHHATSIYAEPFIRNPRGSFGGRTNLQIFYDNGITRTSDLAALKRPADIMPSGKTRWEDYGFTNTRLYVPFNPFSYYDGTKTVNDLGLTLEVINYMAANFGSHCVLGNNSFRAPPWATSGAWVSGTARAGAASTITLASADVATQGQMEGGIIGIDSGPGAGQIRAITAYNTTSKVATVDASWSTNPTSSSVYKYATASTIDNSYVKIYKALNDLPVCIAVQQGNNTQVPAGYRGIPSKSGATELDALVATLDVGFGVVQSGSDPLHLLTGGVNRYHLRYQEIPGAWDDWGLTSEQAAVYNELGQAMPIGL